MEDRPEFPITVTFEDGSEETYENVEDIELNLEDFDSAIDTNCFVSDHSGRKVVLVVNLLKLETLELAA